MWCDIQYVMNSALGGGGEKHVEKRVNNDRMAKQCKNRIPAGERSVSQNDSSGVGFHQEDEVERKEEDMKLYGTSKVEQK